MAAEIELLVKIESGKEELLAYLNERSSIRESRDVEDTYYYDPMRKNLQPDSDGHLRESMRIRDKEGKYFLTHKVDFFDANGKWTYSDEQESTVGSSQEIHQILRNLGLKVLTTVRVHKTYYDIANYELAVEDVDRLGTFLEVEFKGSVTNNHAEIKREIEEFVASLPCRISRNFDGGKPELMLQAFGVDEGPG